MLVKLLISTLLISLTGLVTAAVCDKPIRTINMPVDDIEGIFAREAFARAGCELKIVSTDDDPNFIRRLLMLEQGQYDVIIGVNKRPEREKYAHFSIPIDEELVKLWVRNEEQSKYINMNLTQVLSTGAKLLVPHTGWYGPELETLRTTHQNVVIFNNIEHGLKLLLRHRGDVLLGSENIEQFFEPVHKSNFFKLPQVIHSDTLRLMYSKKTISLKTVKAIDKAIIAMIAEEKQSKSAR